jgi:hypothetical protein
MLDLSFLHFPLIDAAQRRQIDVDKTMRESFRFVLHK